ncbi:hypothetical protein E8E13_001163 [Curvularia kusanoi]|uniref:Uncharacterized protein n=1 Tax=Curvularia kusanoi TaxID=90978 RepID=A0A9P4W1I7_CURKU|nr:hypothetical protein E8E13_001163 [Curvularia kusanoi]
MARLSKAHDEADSLSSTPTPTRKPSQSSSRLREFFKPRRSMDSSSSTALTDSLHENVRLTARPPSNRKSVRAPGRRSMSMAANDVSTPSPKNAMRDHREAFVATSEAVGLDEVLQSHGESMEKLNLLAWEEKVAAVNQPTSSPLDLATPGTPYGPSHQDMSSPTAMMSPSDRTFPGSGQSKPLDQGMSQLAARATPSDRFFPGNPLARQETQKSFASNIFDDQDSLSVGIREYVDSKIAEVLHKHSQHEIVHTSLNVVAKLQLPAKKGMSERSPPDTDAINGSRRLGPWVLNASSETHNLQMGISGMYMLVVMFSALLGPKILFSTLWKLLVFLSSYAVAEQMFGWRSDAHPDLLLAPLVHMKHAVQNAVCNLLEHYVSFQARLNAQAMREAMAEAEVVVEPRG